MNLMEQRQDRREQAVKHLGKAKDAQTMNCILQDIGKYYDADRAYIFEAHMGRRVFNNAAKASARRLIISRTFRLTQWNAGFDIIFMNIQMPKMNGYDAARAIRAMDRSYCKQVPIVAMTANAFAEDVHAAKTVGMNEHIAKPLDLNSLAKILKKWII